MAGCGGHGGDDDGTSTDASGGQPAQPNDQGTLETVAAKAQGNFVPGATLVIELPGYATLSVPGDAFPSPRTIEVAAIVSQETATDWTDTSAIFQPSAVTEHEIRVTTGDAPPSSETASDITLVLIVMDSFLAKVPQTSDVWAFTEVFQDTGEERLDSFEYLGSSYAGDERKVTTALPAFAFTDQRPVTARSFAAIVKVASVPALPAEASTAGARQRTVRQALGGILGRCAPRGLGSPLERDLVGNRYFHLDKRPHPLTGNDTPHDGTDLKTAADGDSVKAAMAGTVIEKIYQENKKKGTGYGWTIVIANGIHTTRYAHLKKDSLKVEVGDKVEEGQILATADSSGRVTGPHLHFEYAMCGLKQEPLLHIRGPFVGIYEGTYESTLENGGVNGELEFQGWADNSVVVETPEAGSGSVSKAGTVNFRAFNRAGASGSFTGTFTGALGAASGGSWVGAAAGPGGPLTAAWGSWSATRLYTPPQ
jgi:murein DD-endopeptidase MepM/ murein hydrolase activator NlpD